ncbi:MAG: HEAT repeat domain-containing protein, partial [Methylococcales bacterium]
TKPIQAVGATIEDGLANRIIEDLDNAKSGIQPIELQIVCASLWKHKAEYQALDLSIYKSSGGARKILKSHLSDTLNRIPFRKRKFMIRVLEALKTPDNTKRYRSFDDLRETLGQGRKSKRLEKMLALLTSLNLVRKDERAGSAWYEYKHDYLAKGIGDWIQEWDEKIHRRRIQYLLIPLLILSIGVASYLINAYETFYFMESRPDYQWQDKEIVINRGNPLRYDPVASTGFFISDLADYEKQKKIADEFKIGDWTYDDWKPLADLLSPTKGAMLLFELGDQEKAIDRLIETFGYGSSHEDAMNNLIRISQGNTGNLVQNRLVIALKNQNETVRRTAADTLGKLGVKDRPVIDALLTALKDHNEDVRRTAAEMLGTLGVKDQAVIDALLAALKDQHKTVRLTAAEMLGTLGVKD